MLDEEVQKYFFRLQPLDQPPDQRQITSNNHRSSELLPFYTFTFNTQEVQQTWRTSRVRTTEHIM